MNTKSKWNGKHKERIDNLKELIPNERLKNLVSYLEGGSALDLACGLGGNSLLLAKLGYQVQAMDISDVAISYLQEQALQQQLTIYPCLADLTEWGSLHLKKDSFDLVVITYYLDRSIFPFIPSIVKENGYFFMETFYRSQLSENQGVSNQYKLQSNELLSKFGDWKVLFFEENEQEGRQTIFCQKCLNES
jgi:tellurite methyltransferase